MPASISSLMTSTDELAGPSVQIILVAKFSSFITLAVSHDFLVSGRHTAPSGQEDVKGMRTAAWLYVVPRAHGGSRNPPAAALAATLPRRARHRSRAARRAPPTPTPRDAAHVKVSAATAAAARAGAASEAPLAAAPARPRACACAARGSGAARGLGRLRVREGPRGKAAKATLITGQQEIMDGAEGSALWR